MILGLGDWLDSGDSADANNGLDPEKLNFLRPPDFRTERERELDESRAAETSKHENCPKLEEIRVIVRKEAIRVVKIIVGASDGGTNNYRRKGKKKAGLRPKDGAKKRRKKSSGSPDVGADASSLELEAMHHSNGLASAWVANGDAYYQSTGLGRPVPNPSRAKKREHPFGPTPVVPIGPMARSNQEMMRHMNMGESTMNSVMNQMMGPQNSAFLNDSLCNLMDKESNDKQHRGGDFDENDMIEKDGFDEKQVSGGGNDNNSTFSGDTHQAGNVSAKNPGEFNAMVMPSYYGMGMGNSKPSGNHNGTGVSAINQNDVNAMPSPENYHEFFKNMRNYAPPGMVGPGAMGQSMYGATPEEFQRMMFARAIGTNAGMHNGMTSMMGMDNPPSLNQGNLYSNAFGDQKKDEEELENLKSMMQGGAMDRQPNDAINQASGQFGNQNLQSMFRSGGFPSSSTPGNQNPYGAVSREQQLCLETGMYGAGDRFGQQLHGAFQGSQYGLAPTPGFGQFGGGRAGSGAAAAAEQQTFLQSLGQTTFPSSNGSGGGGGYSHPFDDMAQLLGMSSSSHPPRSQGNNTSEGPL